MRYPTGRDWRNATRAKHLRAAIQRDEMTLNELRGNQDYRAKRAIQLAKRRIARNTKELEKNREAQLASQAAHPPYVVTGLGKRSIR
jgi:hypothetical protein